jgi:hypothetical protein
VRQLAAAPGLRQLAAADPKAQASLRNPGAAARWLSQELDGGSKLPQSRGGGKPPHSTHRLFTTVHRQARDGRFARP